MSNRTLLAPIVLSFHPNSRSWRSPLFRLCRGCGSSTSTCRPKRVAQKIGVRCGAGAGTYSLGCGTGGNPPYHSRSVQLSRNAWGELQEFSQRAPPDLVVSARNAENRHGSRSDGRHIVNRLIGLTGGYALRQRDLRVLYAVIFLSFLGASITFPLRLLYAQTHGATPAELGIMAAAFIVAPLVAQVPLGWLVDSWGRVPVLILALISHALVSLLFIFFVAPLELIALRFLEGISTAAFQPAESAYIADVTPEEHRSEAYGVLNASLMAGLLVGPLVGGLVGQQLGFRAAFILNVAVEILALLLAWRQVHEPRVHRQLTGDDSSGSWRRLLSTPLLGAYAAFFSMQVVIGMFTALWTIWLHDIGGSYTYIGFTMTVFALPQIFLSAFAGRAADRWGRAPVLVVGSIVIGSVYASYGFITNLAAIVLLGVFEGLIFMFVVPAGQALLADASPAEARGRAQGIAGAVGAVGGAISAFASIPLYHVSRPIPFVGSAVAVVVGSCLAAAGALALANRRRAEPARPLAKAADG